MQLNISSIKDIKVLDEPTMNKESFEKLLESKKKYIELVVPQNEECERRNVFERCLRLFSSFERYTWNDRISGEYVIAVVYYEHDLSLSNSEERRIYRRDTIIPDILSLGRYIRVLKEPRFVIPSDTPITYDSRIYNGIGRVCRMIKGTMSAEIIFAESQAFTSYLSGMAVLNGAQPALFQLPCSI